MRWLVVPKGKWLGAGVLCAALVFAFVFYFHPIIPAPNHAGASLQIGFYDVMSERQEIYNAEVKSEDGKHLATITSAQDSHFMLKTNFTETNEISGHHFFSYNPVIYQPSQSNAMLEGMADMLQHTGIWTQTMDVHGQPLIATENGVLILYTPHAPPPLPPASPSENLHPHDS